jgi:hypothetical protein
LKTFAPFLLFFQLIDIQILKSSFFAGANLINLDFLYKILGPRSQNSVQHSGQSMHIKHIQLSIAFEPGSSVPEMDAVTTAPRRQLFISILSEQKFDMHFKFVL